LKEGKKKDKYKIIVLYKPNIVKYNGNLPENLSNSSSEEENKPENKPEKSKKIKRRISKVSFYESPHGSS
jgi:hypothetical protein